MCEQSEGGAYSRYSTVTSANIQPSLSSKIHNTHAAIKNNIVIIHKINNHKQQTIKCVVKQRTFNPHSSFRNENGTGRSSGN